MPPLPTNAPSFRSLRANLRKNQTYAEYLLWSKLRSKQMLGIKFYRQYSIGYYILDFYAHEKKLAIEIDGGQHNDPLNKENDKRRTQFLERQGIRVMRFWDNEVISNMNGVLEAIVNTINSP